MPPAISERIDDVRTRWDPEMARRIQPHVTIVHDAAGIDDLEHRVDLVATSRPFVIRLTDVQCWDTPEGGIYLGVDDDERGIESIRRSLQVVEPAEIAYVPHVTLVHPRTATPERAREAWTLLAGWTVDEIVTIDRVAIVELDGDRWAVRRDRR